MTSSYSADQIQVLDGIEIVRKRPRIYIGSTDSRGLHYLVYAALDNSIYEAMAGHCTHIEVDLNADGSVKVTDNGRGIPTDIDPHTGKSVLETVMTVMGIGNMFEGRYKLSNHLHGIGIGIINPLSEWLDVTVWRNQQVYTQRFERGVPVSELQVKASQENRTETSFCFKPDPAIFTAGTEFDSTVLAKRLQQLASLNAGVKIVLSDRRPILPTGTKVAFLADGEMGGLGDGGSSEHKSSPLPHLPTTRSTKSCDRDRAQYNCPKVAYHYKDGIREYLACINREKKPLHEEIIYIQGERDNVQVEVALQWCADAETEILSFVNNLCAITEGTHMAGLKAGVIKTLNAFVRKGQRLNENNTHLWGKWVRQGLTGIIYVRVPEPEYTGATKDRLCNLEVWRIVYSLVTKVLSEYLDSHPGVAGAILNQASRRGRVLLNQ